MKDHRWPNRHYQVTIPATTSQNRHVPVELFVANEVRLYNRVTGQLSQKDEPTDPLSLILHHYGGADMSTDSEAESQNGEQVEENLAVQADISKESKGNRTTIMCQGWKKELRTVTAGRLLVYLTPPNETKPLRSYCELQKWVQGQAEIHQTTHFNWKVINFNKRIDEELKNPSKAHQSFLDFVQQLEGDADQDAQEPGGKGAPEEEATDNSSSTSEGQQQVRRIQTCTLDPRPTRFIASSRFDEQDDDDAQYSEVTEGINHSELQAADEQQGEEEAAATFTTITTFYCEGWKKQIIKRRCGRIDVLLTPPTEEKALKSYSHLTKWVQAQAEQHKTTDYNWAKINFDRPGKTKACAAKESFLSAMKQFAKASDEMPDKIKQHRKASRKSSESELQVNSFSKILLHTIADNPAYL